MQMTAAEICREYRTAKNPAGQIGILADLNACSPGHIKKILQENGEAVSLPQRPAKAPAQRTIEKPGKALERETIKDEEVPATHPLVEMQGRAGIVREYIEQRIEKRKRLAEELRAIDAELYQLVNLIADGTEKL